jgi:aminocarboxymuconate-semialdehyde decarboxylase
VDVVGSSQVMFGSDYPHIVGDMAGMRSNVEALGTSTARRISSENAQRIFRL